MPPLLQDSRVQGRGFTTEAQAQDYIKYLEGGWRSPQEQTTPTVLTDANIREDVIPNLNQKVNSLYGTPTSTTKKEEPKPEVDYSKLLGLDETKETASPLDQEYTDIQEDIFKQMETEVSETAKKGLESLANQLSQRKRDIGIQQGAAGAQKAGLQSGLFASGASRYGTVSGGGIVTSTERQLMNTLSDLSFQEREAIEKVREAQKTGDWKVVQARLDYAEGIRAEKEKRRNELMKEVKEENKKVREKQIQASRDQAVAGLLGQNPNMSMTDMLDALNETGGDFTAEELAETVKSLTGEKDTKKAYESLSADLQDYYALQESYPEAIPEFIKKLPPNQQPYAYVKYAASLTRAPEKPKGAFTLNATGRQKLLGASIPMSQISAIEEYLATYGFDQQLKDSLGDAAPVLQSVLSGSGEDMGFLD